LFYALSQRLNTNRSDFQQQLLWSFQDSEPSNIILTTDHAADEFPAITAHLVEILTEPGCIQSVVF
jgi:hypothetical protein